MVPQPSAILIWAVRIPGGELRCVTWQVGGQWSIRVDDQELATYAQAIAPDLQAVCRWAIVVRREIDRLGLGGSPAFDPDIDVTIDPADTADTLDAIVDDRIACTDARARRH